MRLLIKEYAPGGRSASELSDDGGDFIRELAGPRKVGERICAFVDAACDENQHGVDRLLEALAWLTEEIRKRRGAMPPGEGNAHSAGSGPRRLRQAARIRRRAR